MLPDKLTGDLREVDVTIAHGDAHDRRVTAIECTDRSRKADLPWVDSMWGKHQFLDTDHLVLASRGGFSRTALEKARALGMETIDLSDGVAPESVGLIIGADGEIWVRSWFPEIEGVAIGFGDATEGEQAVELGTLLCHRGGCPIGHVGQFGADRPELTSFVKQTVEATPFSVLDLLRRTQFHSPIAEDEEPVFIVNDRTGELIPVTRVRLELSIEIHSTRVPLTHATLGGLPTAWGHWTLDGRSYLMIASEPTGRDPRISMLEQSA
jgi:hypothetical protein